MKRKIQKQKRPSFHSWDPATDSYNIGNVLEICISFCNSVYLKSIYLGEWYENAEYA